MIWTQVSPLLIESPPYFILKSPATQLSPLRYILGQTVSKSQHPSGMSQQVCHGGFDSAEEAKARAEELKGNRS